MAKGVKKITWASEVGILPQYSKPSEIVCIQADQIAYFKVSEWYSDTTPEDKRRNVQWMCLNEEQLTVFYTITKHPDEPFGIKMPRKLCGSYAYYIEASLYGKHDVRNTGLYVYGKCQEKITKASWSKQQNATNQSEIHYGHHLFINIEAEGINGDIPKVEVYNKKDKAQILQSQKVKCINGNLVFKLDTMPCFRAIGGFPEEVEEFCIKVRDYKDEYITNASHSEEILSFKITDEFVFPEFEVPTNKTLLKTGTPEKKKEEEDKKEEINSSCYCITDLTKEILQSVAPNATTADIEKYIEGFNKTFKKFKIDSCLKKVHFLAQIIHESGSFKFNEEQGTAVYLATYNGWHGRGLIQLTLKENYEAFGTAIGEDVTSSASNRNKVTQSPYAVYSAGWFWENKKLNELANINDFIYITFKVNGGFNHIDDRLKRTKTAFGVLYSNCKNDINKTTEYKFSESKGYENKKCSFAWGLWHDPLFTKTGCAKNKDKAIEGYQRYIDLTNANDQTTNYYKIANYDHFEDLVITVGGVKKVKVRDAAIKRVNELKEV